MLIFHNIELGNILHIQRVKFIPCVFFIQGHQTRQILDIYIGGMLRQKSFTFLKGRCFFFVINGAEGFSIGGIIIRIAEIDKIVACGGNKTGKQGAGRQTGRIYTHYC